MNTPTFKEQFDKITTAYFEGRLSPERPCGCFIGNLLNNTEEWNHARVFTSQFNPVVCERRYPNDEWERDYIKEGIMSIEILSNGLYTIEDIIDLEQNFLNIARTGVPLVCTHEDIDSFYTEETLFAAIDSTLDLLRKIHESKGEIIEDFEFSKRSVPL